MALLQLSDPFITNNESTELQEVALGIDLGTTNSLVVIAKQKTTQLLVDEHGALLPSQVHFLSDQKTTVGHLNQKPLQSIYSVKRLMGLNYEQAYLLNKSTQSFDLVEVNSDELDSPCQLATIQGNKSPVEISAQILAVLLERAHAQLTDKQILKGAVITVPAYFNAAQRQATIDAALLAQIEVLRLINEPTAAAIAYGLDQRSDGTDGTFAVYDFGGGTFDISILKFDRGLFKVIATKGDSALGGDDFDQSLATYWQQTYPSAKNIPAAKLRNLAKEAKIILSDEESWVSQDYPEIKINRTDFIKVCAYLIDKSMVLLDEAIKDAKLSAKDLDGIILVGGTTRIPQISSCLQEKYNLTIFQDIDPDQVVAMGAGLQASQLIHQQTENWLLADVTPLSLGIELAGGLVETIIPRNSHIPITKKQIFTTQKDNQTAISIHVVQGEREFVQDCRSLARFSLNKLPPAVAGSLKMEVTFKMDADGLLTVSALETHSQQKVSIMIKPSYGLASDQITNMIEESFKHATRDVQQRKLQSKIVDATLLVNTVNAALTADANLLSPDQVQLLNQSTERLHQLCQSSLIKNTNCEATDKLLNSINKIEKEYKIVGQLADEFAQVRMDYHIKQGLAGKSVERFAK